MGALYVAVGGALGAVARYGVSGWVQAAAGGIFPWGTLVVNVLGSAGLGFAVVWLQAGTVAPEVRELVTIGLLGAFTTFSTFSYETAAMLRDGDVLGAGAYTAGSLVLGLVGAFGGLFLASLLLRAGG